jgi:hypothetical protein
MQLGRRLYVFNNINPHHILNSLGHLYHSFIHSTMSLEDSQIGLAVSSQDEQPPIQETPDIDISSPSRKFPLVNPKVMPKLVREFTPIATYQGSVVSPTTPGPFKKEIQQQGVDSPKVEESIESRLERLGRQRPEVFESIWAEIGFVFSISMSQVLSVSFLS